MNIRLKIINAIEKYQRKHKKRPTKLIMSERESRKFCELTADDIGTTAATAYQRRGPLAYRRVQGLTLVIDPKMRGMKVC